MWISKAHYLTMNNIIESAQNRNTEMLRRDGERIRLEIENARLRADMDWFKHRLNQVERERGQLIQASIGVKISIPEFVPSFEDPVSALQQMPDLSSIGEDALDQGPETDVDPSVGVDYSMMPGYSGSR